ncbi:hypothetical protein DVQ78_19490 [Yersinia enterocolitica]|nr:hypothetical protein [Yersinia enterocolitica]
MLIKIMNVLLLGLVLLALPSRAEVVEMNNTPVLTFIHWYAQQTGKPVVVSPGVLGTVTVFNGNVTPENIDVFFQSVLHVYQYCAVPGNPVVISIDCPT